MSTLELNVYEILKTKFGEKEAKVVIEYFEAKAEEKINQKKDLFITQSDKGKLLTKEDAFNIFATKEDLANVKSDMIKWMFIFWITQMISLFAFMLYFVKK